MTDRPNRRSRSQKSEEAVIDHVADIATDTSAQEQGERQSPLTPSGQPVEDQINKEWDQKKGGLPTFFPARR
jgi:hypothetical protein